MTILRYLSVFLLAAGHLQAVLPILAPLSFAVFVICHFPYLELRRREPIAVLCAIMFVGWYFAMLFVHGMIRDYSIVELMRTNGRIVYMVSLFLFVAHLNPQAHLERPLLIAVPVCLCVASLLSMYSRFVRPIVIGDIQMSSLRSLTGFFENHNTMAGALGATLVVIAAAWLHRQQRYFPRLFGYFTALMGAFLGLAFALSLSRSYTLGIIAAGVCVAFMIPRFTTRFWTSAVALGLGIALAAFVVINRSEGIDSDNVDSRRLLYSRAVREIKLSPIIGIGPGSFQEVHGVHRSLIRGVIAVRQSGSQTDTGSTHDYYGEGGAHVHNTYLQLMCDTGAIGTGLFFLIFLTAGRQYWSVRKSLMPKDALSGLIRWHAKVVLLSFIYLSVAGCFVNWCYSSPPYTLFLYTSLGRLTMFVSLRKQTRLSDLSFSSTVDDMESHTPSSILVAEPV